VHVGGIGDKGMQNGYLALAGHIQIGELEFQDCVVTVSDKHSIVDEDGLIGADVFGGYLIDIDFPGMRFKLSPLPKRPEDAVAPKSLNSQGEEQAHAEQKEEDAIEQNLKEKEHPPAASKPARRLPKDRYVAPEMADWTKVFRLGHAMLVPTRVNDAKPSLFGLDTGAFNNILSLRAGRQLGKVSKDWGIRVRGLNGEVKTVYSAKATLRFGHLQQPDLDIVTLDLTNISHHFGTEVSGFLGFGMLKLLDLKLDYRDGLVDFHYDPKRVPRFPR